MTKLATSLLFYVVLVMVAIVVFRPSRPLVAGASGDSLVWPLVMIAVALSALMAYFARRSAKTGDIARRG